MSDESKTAYCAVMRDASVAGKTLMICKGQDSFPTNSERMTGFIDVWWVFDILPARGLLLLIPYLLRYSKVRAWDSRALSPLRCLHSSSSSSPPCLCVEWEAERNGSAVWRVRQVTLGCELFARTRRFVRSVSPVAPISPISSRRGEAPDSSDVVIELGLWYPPSLDHGISNLASDQSHPSLLITVFVKQGPFTRAREAVGRIRETCSKANFPKCVLHPFTCAQRRFVGSMVAEERHTTTPLTPVSQSDGRRATGVERHADAAVRGDGLRGGHERSDHDADVDDEGGRHEGPGARCADAGGGRPALHAPDKPGFISCRTERKPG